MNESSGYVQRVNKDGNELAYWIANDTCKWRVDTLFKKEPETLRWLERLPSNAHLLDIGANVGMYTIYAAVLKSIRVTAIEPESQNFALLCKNIHLNSVQSLVMPYNIGISDKSGLTKLFLSSFMWDGGSSCHSMGEEVGFDLKPRPSPFAQGTAAFSLDDFIKQSGESAESVPNAIKLDVDGFEHLVIRGSIDTLTNPEVKTLCIEINYNLSEHRDMIKQLESLGYYCCEEQVERSMRREGAFKGCAEVILDRIKKNEIIIINTFNPQKSACHEGSAADSAFADAISKIESSATERDPFPAVYISNLFPSNYFDEMQRYFPRPDQVQSLGETGRVSSGAYPERLVTLFTEEHFQRLDQAQQDFWGNFAQALTSEEFVNACINKFAPWCSNRLAELRDKHNAVRVRNDALLVNDRTNYAIGPHTDLPHRLISLLFYLPKDENLKYLGTSFYKHKDPNFRCPGGPHYNFEDFTRLGSAPFLPNSLLMFVRTGTSFHGVEPIKQQGVERKLLISNIRLVDHEKG